MTGFPIVPTLSLVSLERKLLPLQVFLQRAKCIQIRAETRKRICSILPYNEKGHGGKEHSKGETKLYGDWFK